VKAFTAACAVFACLLSGAALAVSLTHPGPRGAQGPPGRQGDAGTAAQTARLGICWSDSIFTQTWADGSASTWVNGVSLDQPVLSNGVYTCPQGETFVSIVPQPTQAGTSPTPP
jgi:hypothetical protein